MSFHTANEKQMLAEANRPANYQASYRSTESVTF